MVSNVPINYMQHFPLFLHRVERNVAPKFDPLMLLQHLSLGLDSKVWLKMHNYCNGSPSGWCPEGRNTQTIPYSLSIESLNLKAKNEPKPIIYLSICPPPIHTILPVYNIILQVVGYV